MADDIEFEKAMSGVRRLKKDSVQPTPVKRQSNSALRSQIQNRAIKSAVSSDKIYSANKEIPHAGQSNEKGDNTLFFIRNGVQKKVLRELKKGSRYPVKETLDLHGLTQIQAQSEIDLAVVNLEPSRLTCLLIIHGKGLHSTHGARLKTFTSEYLKTLPAVKAYCSAQQRDGGTGAVYALVRGNPDHTPLQL